MHRKKVFLLFVSLVLMSLFSGTASAAEDDGSLSGVADTIHGLFGFLPNIITLDKLVGEDAAAMFWARFLVWLLLFAVIYFGAGFVFKDKKNIATVVALVISLMSALLISDTIVINIFLTYGFVAGLLIWVIPVAAGFYLVTKVQFKLLKALIYLIMLFVLMSIDSSITSGFGESLVNNTWYSLFRLLLAVVMIAFLWNLLTAWMDGGGGGGGTRRGINWDWINRPDDRRRDNRRDDDGHDRRDDDGRRDDDRPTPSPPTPPPDDDEKDTDKKELIEEKKFFRLLSRIYNDIYRMSSVSAATKVKAKLKKIQNEIIILNNLQYQEEKAENLTEEYLTKLGFSKTKRKQLLELIKYEETSLKRVNHLFEDLKEAVENVLVGEKKRIAVVNKVKTIKTPKTLEHYTSVIIPGLEEVIKDNGERLKSDLYHMVKIVELLIHINLEELKNLK